MAKGDEAPAQTASRPKHSGSTSAVHDGLCAQGGLYMESRGERRILARFGEGWSIKSIDLERVAYRKLCDGYDVEVSGLFGGRRPKTCDVYVWKTQEGFSPTIAARRTDVDPKDVPSVVSELQREIADGAE